MKKSILTLFAMLAMFSIAASQGQDYVFKVLVNKGNNEYKAGGNWQAIKTGSVLKTKDELKLGPNSYVGLIHVSGKPLEVKQPGSYKVDDLSSKVNGGSSVLNKYTDFILSSNTQNKNRMAATGAVHRGVGSLKIYLPKAETAVLYNNEFILDWEKKEGAKGYVISVQTLFGNELFKTETNEKIVRINFSDPKYTNEDNLIVEVFPKGEPGKKADPPYMIKKVSKADKERIKTSIAEIAEMTKDNTPLNKLILAGFYEQNRLLVDAGTMFQEAILLAPDVQEYQDQYNNFLIRNGIKEEKKTTGTK